MRDGAELQGKFRAMLTVWLRRLRRFGRKTVGRLGSGTLDGDVMFGWRQGVAVWQAAPDDTRPGLAQIDIATRHAGCSFCSVLFVCSGN